LSHILLPFTCLFFLPSHTPYLPLHLLSPRSTFPPTTLLLYLLPSLPPSLSSSNPPIILPFLPPSLSHWRPTSLIDSLTPTPPQTTPPFAIPLHSTSLYSTLIHSTPYHFPLLSFVVLGPSIICILFLRRILTLLKKANRLLVCPRHSGILRCSCGHYCYIIGSMFPGIQAKTEVVILGPSTSLHKISG
jgi:hypothetical protein